MGDASADIAITAAEASRPGLSALFAPRSIAFVGVSEKTNAPATRGLRHCLRLGFDGPLFGVNPKYTSLFDRPCVASVSALPQPVDLAVIALPAAASLDAVAECQRTGVRTVVLCSSGWGEGTEEGRQRERELRAVVKQGSMRLLGPNCIGVGGATAKFCVAYNSSFEHLSFRHKRPIGVVCQSGAMLGGMLLNAEDAGVGVEAYVHVGNGVDITLEEAAAELLQRAEIRTLALMIEGLSDGRAFVRLARLARSMDKRIAVYKAGRSDIGRRSVQSHTGALAGEDAIFDAVCVDEGIVRVAEPEDLLPVARMLCDRPATQGRRALVFTLSGGGASALADELEAHGLDVPPLGAATVDAIAAMNDPFLRAGNPFDVGSSVFSDPGAAARALALAARDDAVDAVCWIGVGAPRDERSQFLLESALGALADCGKPAVVLPMSGTPAEPGFESAHRLNIAVARSVRSASLLLHHALAPRSHDASGCQPKEHARPRSADNTVVLREFDARQMLSRAGIPVLPSEFVATDDELAQAAERIGYPLVLKGVADGVAHKTEAGLVHLRIRDITELRNAARAMVQRLGAQLGAKLGGFTLERMLEGGIETVVGVRVDEQFGPMLMFGLGGTAVEVMRQVAFTQCPCDSEAALRLIRATFAWPLLQGFRGAPPADIAALTTSIRKLGEFAVENQARLLEVEINPFIVLPQSQGAFAVDALIIQRD